MTSLRKYKIFLRGSQYKKYSITSKWMVYFLPRLNPRTVGRVLYQQSVHWLSSKEIVNSVFLISKKAPIILPQPVKFQSKFHTYTQDNYKMLVPVLGI